jgi:hypothetical protein
VKQVKARAAYLDAQPSTAEAGDPKPADVKEAARH